MTKSNHEVIPNLLILSQELRTKIISGATMDQAATKESDDSSSSDDGESDAIIREAMKEALKEVLQTNNDWKGRS